MIGNLIDELVRYGIKSGITDEEDRIYSTNTLLAILGVSDFELEQGGSIPEIASMRFSTRPEPLCRRPNLVKHPRDRSNPQCCSRPIVHRKTAG